MTATYSTYDVEANPAEVLALVREGETVVISDGGRVFAEIRPLPTPMEANAVNGAAPHPTRRKAQTNEERYAELLSRGAITPAMNPGQPIEPGEPAPGALARFLGERHGCGCDCGCECGCKRISHT